MVTKRSCVALLLAGAALVGCSKKGEKEAQASNAVAPGNGSSMPSVNPGVAPGGPTATPNGGATVVRANLLSPRGGHTATLLATGDVLAAGGDGGGIALDTAEVYRGTAWVGVAKLAGKRMNHSATLLPSGKVLIAGGQSDPQGTAILKSTEVFDPATGTFAAGPDLSVERSGHAAVAFRDAQGDFVLIAGGASLQGGQRASTASAEVYDVRAAKFVPIASMKEDRVGARALALANGNVLIQGGLTGLSTGSVQVKAAGVEVFDIASRTFSKPQTMSVDRFSSSLTLADSGQALVLGGNSQAQVEASGEAFDAATGAWTALQNPLAQAREGHTATALGAGSLIVAGGAASGNAIGSIELLRQGTQGVVDGTFVALSSLQDARRDHTATRLTNGHVLFTGGFNAQGQPVATSEEYDPLAAPGQPVAPPPTTALPPSQPPGPTVPPMILSILPGSGRPGLLVTIAGNGFSTKKNQNIVTFGGGRVANVIADVKLANLPLLGLVQTLVVEVPYGAQTGDVTVAVGGLSSAGRAFTIDLASAPTPKVLLTLPKKGKPGSIVTLFGHDFAKPATDNIVKFAGVQASPIGGITTQSIPFLGNVAVMVVTVPQGAVTGDLTVEAFGKVSGGVRFEVPGTGAPPQPSQPTSTTPSTPSTPSAPTTPSTPSTPSAPSAALFTEDFDGSTLQVRTTDSAVWLLSSAPSGTGRPASGTRALTTGGGSARYAPNKNAYLLLPDVDLGSAAAPVLKFKHWYRFGSGDGGHVIVSADNGASYWRLTPRGDYPSQAVASLANHPGFAGSSATGFQEAVFDLAAYKGKKVKIALRFASDASGEDLGWVIDDLKVEANGGASTSSSPSTTSTSTSTSPTTSTSTSSSTLPVIWKEDCDGTTVRLMRSGGAIWKAGVPTAGPGRAASGTRCAGTGLTEDCPAGVDAFLMTEEIDLSNVAVAELSIRHWLSTHGQDAARVVITSDGGQHYYLLRPKGGYPVTNLAAFTPGEGFAGRSNGWVEVKFDLSRYAGKKVRIVFEYKSDTAGRAAGWYVDDIAVRGT